MPTVTYVSDDDYAAFDERRSPAVGSYDAYPNLASLTGGGFVIAIEAQDGVFAQRHDLDGKVTGFVTQLDPVGREPVVIGLASGGYVVAWTASVPGGVAVRAQAFNADGAAAGAVFEARDTTAYQQQPTLAALADGGFVIAWTEQAPAGQSIRAAMFAANGAVTVPDIVVAQSDGGNYSPQLAGLADGGFVIGWSGRFGNIFTGVGGRIYDGAGNPSGPVFSPSLATSETFYQSVARLASGDFVMTWSESPLGGQTVISGQRYTAAGALVGNSFQVNTETEYVSGQSTVTALGDGFIVTWFSDVPDGINAYQRGDVKAQLFDAAGNKRGGEFRVNFETDLRQGAPSVAAFGTDDFAIAWQSYGEYGDTSVDLRTFYSTTDGTAATESIIGTAGVDFIRGFAGNDTVAGLDADDHLDGGNGNDRLDGGAGNDNIVGGAGRDTLSGGAGADTISGGADDDSIEGGTGDDRILGDGGNDLLAGGDGVDRLFGGADDDIAIGGAGNDVLYGDDGADVLLGDSGQDYILGGNGNDRLEGGADRDTLFGDAGADTLLGGDDGDFLDGGTGDDLLFGGSGDDSYTVDSAADLTFEQPGGGVDLVEASASVYLFANIENLLISDAAGAAFGVGNALANYLGGNESANLLLGGDGADILFGRGGNDLLYGEAGDDAIAGNDGIDYIAGGIGNDTLDGNADADALYGEDGDDTLAGGLDFNTDILVGGNGNDTLFAASGLGDYDLINGGAGDDAYHVDTPDDLTFEAAGGGTDTVYARIQGAGFYLYANTENLVLEGNTPFGVGNELANILTGNAENNYLLGGLGNDTLNGKAGADVLFGEAGADLFVFERYTTGDVIGDFQPGIDRIALTGLGFTSFAQLAVNFVENAGTTAIDLGQGDFIVLNGIANARLSAADFILG